MVPLWPEMTRGTALGTQSPTLPPVTISSTRAPLSPGKRTTHKPKSTGTPLWVTVLASLMIGVGSILTILLVAWAAWKLGVRILQLFKTLLKQTFQLCPLEASFPLMFPYFYL